MYIIGEREVHKQQEKARKRSKHRHASGTDLALRPSGRPGRSAGKGYSIITELGLADRKEHYNFVLVCHFHLLFSCTGSKSQPW